MQRSQAGHGQHADGVVECVTVLANTRVPGLRQACGTVARLSPSTRSAWPALRHRPNWSFRCQRFTDAKRAFVLSSPCGCAHARLLPTRGSSRFGQVARQQALTPWRPAAVRASGRRSSCSSCTPSPAHHSACSAAVAGGGTPQNWADRRYGTGRDCPRPAVEGRPDALISKWFHG
jgi:hypothetical protein